MPSEVGSTSSSSSAPPADSRAASSSLVPTRAAAARSATNGLLATAPKTTFAEDTFPLVTRIAEAQFDAGGPIVGRGFFVREFPEYDRDSLEGYFFVPSLHDPTFVAHIAEVEVNVLTGKVRVTRYVAAQDLGRCINPLGAEGQIQGGAVQGMGYALYEEMIHDEAGLTVNPSFGDYKLPTIADVPPIEPIIIEGHYGSGPYGAKGVGEANIVPPAGAIANAVYDAVGVRVRSLPMRPERVLEAMDGLASRKDD